MDKGQDIGPILGLRVETDRGTKEGFQNAQRVKADSDPQLFPGLCADCLFHQFHVRRLRQHGNIGHDITVTTNDGGKTVTCTVIVTPAAGAIVVEISAMNDDGTYTAYGMFLGAVEFTYDSTYEVIDGVLNVPDPGLAVTTSFGEYPPYPTVEVYGDTVCFSVLSDNGSEITLGYYELTPEDAAKLGITVGDPIEEVAVAGVSLIEESVTITTGSKLDLSSIVAIAPEEATNKEYAVTTNATATAQWQKSETCYLLLLLTENQNPFIIKTVFRRGEHT